MEMQGCHAGLLLSDEELTRYIQFFKVLGDTTRMKILLLILDEELCVGEIAGRLGLSDSLVSHHLRLLRLNHLIRKRREGKVIFYTSADRHVKEAILLLWEHMAEKEYT